MVTIEFLRALVGQSPDLSLSFASPESFIRSNGSNKASATVGQQTSDLQSSAVFVPTSSYKSKHNTRLQAIKPQLNPVMVHMKRTIGIVHAPLVPRNGRRYFHLSLGLHSHSHGASSSTYVQSESDEERQFRFAMARGTQKYSEGRLDEALASFKNASALRPTSLDALTNTASVAESAGRLDVAMEFAIKVLELSKRPDTTLDPVALANEYSRVSRIYSKQGKLYEAHKLLREGISVYPSDALFKELHDVEKQMGLKMTFKQFPTEELKTERLFREIASHYSFEVRMTPNGRGRGLFATKDFSNGDILFVESPVAAVADVDTTDQEVAHCKNCLRQINGLTFGFASAEAKAFLGSFPADENQKLRDELEIQVAGSKCSPTKDELNNVFCSTDCRDSMWKSSNSTLAPLIRSNDPILKQILPSSGLKSNEVFAVKDLYTIEIITRIVARKQVQPEIWDSYLSKLVYAEYDPPLPLLEQELQQLKALRQAFPSERDFLSEQNFKRLKSIVELNAFSIEAESVGIQLDVVASEGDSDGPPASAAANQSKQLKLNIEVNDEPLVRGHALYRLSSLMNHSCDPNVGLASPNVSANVAWVALKPIKLGEELLDSYIPLDERTDNREHRRNLLYTNYKFWCSCGLCASGK